METAFQVGPCPKCTRSVVTARDLTNDKLVDRCIHCDTLLSSAELSWASAREVVELGYFIDGYRDEVTEKERGCRGGACGVQQR